MTLPEIISEARELLAKATKGPWEAHISGDKRRGCINVPDEKLSPLCSYNPNDFAYCSGRASSLEFIAFARNHLPEILDELERRGKALSNLVKANREWMDSEPEMTGSPSTALEDLEQRTIEAQSILSGESGV